MIIARIKSIDRIIATICRIGLGTLVVLLLTFYQVYANEYQTHVIQFSDFSYNPSSLNVAVGDTILWQGNFMAHPLESSSVPEGADHFGPVTSGTEFIYVVEVEGTYTYDCNLHHASYGMSGSFTATVTSVEDSDQGIPDVFQLEQNYPNPFNPATEILFSLPERMEITLEVYAIHGEHITTLVDGIRDAGFHTVTFDATGLSSGMYLYRLRSEQSVEVRRMVYIR